MMIKKLLNILIVDDEPIIAFSIKKMLKNMDFHRIEMAHEESTAKGHLQTKKVDLAILDINLGKGEEGIQLAELCKQKGIPFLYVSSYSDNLTLDKAIKTAPGAYVVKPFLAANLYASVEITLSKAAVQEEAKFFTLKDKGNLIKLKYDDIIYLKADDIYSEIFTEQKAYIYRSSLKKLISEFSTDQMLKVHRAYAVNLAHVTEIGATTVHLGALEIPLSRTFKQELIEEFEKNGK